VTNEDGMQGSKSVLVRLARVSLLTSSIVAAGASACSTQANYVDPEGPRYAADGVAVTQDTGPWLAAGPAPVETIKVVSYNLRYGREIDAAIEVLAGSPELAGADVILLQEMDALGVELIAHALGCSYVYYPAALRRSGRDFGNAVLTRGRIVEDRKVLLPHKNPINRQQRIGVRTDLELGRRTLRAYLAEEAL